MARIPAVLYAAVLSQALPLVAAVFHRGRRNMPAPVKWVLLWCAVLLLADAASQLVARVRGENLSTSYVTVPLMSSVALWMLSSWQLHPLLRLGYRVSIPVLLFATAATLLLFKPGPAFDNVVWPAYGLVLLTASLHTLVHRSLRAEGSITRAAWFWVSLGMSLYFATRVALRPFAQALLVSHPDWVVAAYIAKAWINILAFLLITGGVLCDSLPFPSRAVLSRGSAAGSGS